MMKLHLDKWGRLGRPAFLRTFLPPPLIFLSRYRSTVELLLQLLALIFQLAPRENRVVIKQLLRFTAPIEVLVLHANQHRGLRT